MRIVEGSTATKAPIRRMEIKVSTTKAGTIRRMQLAANLPIVSLKALPMTRKPERAKKTSMKA